MPFKWNEFLRDMQELEADNRELKMKLADAQEYIRVMEEKVDKFLRLSNQDAHVAIALREENKQLKETVRHLEAILDEERHVKKESSLEEKLAEVIEKVLERNGLL